MIYWASKGGTSDVEIQHQNLDIAVQKLARCALHGESFFYVVPASLMFDMNIIGKSYKESNQINPTCLAGQICSIMENKVLQYEHGFVLRTMPLVDSDDFIALFNSIENWKDERLVDSSFQFSSRVVVENLTKGIENGGSHIQHIFSGIRFTLSYIIYKIFTENCPNIEFDPNGIEIFPNLLSSLGTENINNEAVTQAIHQTYEIGEVTIEELRGQYV